jgi:hypothetical protein
MAVYFCGKIVTVVAAVSGLNSGGTISGWVEFPATLSDVSWSFSYEWQAGTFKQSRTALSVRQCKFLTFYPTPSPKFEELHYVT